MIEDVVTLADIKVYKVLTSDYRAYLKRDAAIEAWGVTKERAIQNLAKIMVQKNIPFTLSDI